jgi:hypothetical protein
MIHFSDAAIRHELLIDPLLFILVAKHANIQISLPPAQRTGLKSADGIAPGFVTAVTIRRWRPALPVVFGIVAETAPQMVFRRVRGGLPGAGMAGLCTQGSLPPGPRRVRDL